MKHAARFDSLFPSPLLRHPFPREIKNRSPPTISPLILEYARRRTATSNAVRLSFSGKKKATDKVGFPCRVLCSSFPVRFVPLRLSLSGRVRGSHLTREISVALSLTWLAQPLYYALRVLSSIARWYTVSSVSGRTGNVTFYDEFSGVKWPSV